MDRTERFYKIDQLLQGGLSVSFVKLQEALGIRATGCPDCGSRPRRPDQPGREVPRQPEVAARHLHRLRLRDQYHIHNGSRLSQRLAEAGIRHRYEEFDDDHSDIDCRMDVSLPFLYRALMP